MPRTDSHRPAEIVPVDYAYVEVFYQGINEDMWDAYKGEHKFLDEVLGVNGGPWDENPAFNGPNWKSKGTCDHCGAHFAHGVVYRHEPTGDLIAVGHICAANTMLSGLDKAARVRQRAEKAAAAGRERAKRAAEREAFLAEHPGLAEALTTDHEIVADINRRFRNTDRTFLSDKQIALVFKLAAEAPEREAKEAQWAAEREAAEEVPVTDERLAITGEVIKVDWQDNEFGGRTVITVKTDRGFLLWGSRPSALCGVERGDRVSFSAKVERSDRDPKFGFFKRPTKASFIGTDDSAPCEHAPYFAPAGECEECDQARAAQEAA